MTDNIMSYAGEVPLVDAQDNSIKVNLESDENGTTLTLEVCNYPVHLFLALNKEQTLGLERCLSDALKQWDGLAAMSVLKFPDGGRH